MPFVLHYIYLLSLQLCRSGDSDRHTEHMDKVRLFHQSLQEQTASHSVCSGSAGDIDPSSSFLFAALRYQKDSSTSPLCFRAFKTQLYQHFVLLFTGGNLVSWITSRDTLIVNSQLLHFHPRVGRTVSPGMTSRGSKTHVNFLCSLDS